jgi:hypothetical protein
VLDYRSNLIIVIGEYFMRPFFKKTTSFFADSPGNISELDCADTVIDDSNAKKTNFSVSSSTEFFKQEKSEKIQPTLDPVLGLSWAYELDAPAKSFLLHKPTKKGTIYIVSESESGESIYYKQLSI